MSDLLFAAGIFAALLAAALVVVGVAIWLVSRASNRPRARLTDAERAKHLRHLSGAEALWMLGIIEQEAPHIYDDLAVRMEIVMHREAVDGS